MPQSDNATTVSRDFWPKLKKSMAHLPFAEEAVAAYYCAFDSTTPVRAKGILLAALAYFILPFDIIPDFVLGVGFTDDMAVLLAAITAIRSHMTPAHYDRARATLARMKAEDVVEGDAPSATA
jgi:uncharacterized membrane protein YkvA (DUF1232 family)